mgnify:CR=1 FL=1
MEKLIEFILKLIETKNIILIILTVFAIFFILVLRFFITHYDNVIRIFGYSGKAKNNCDLDNLTDSITDKEIKELQETKRFQQCFGIYVEKKRREKLIAFHNENEIKLTWKEIKAAIRYFNFSEDGISVNIKKLDRFSFKASNIASIFLILFGILGITFIVGISDKLELRQFTAFILVFLPFIFLGFGIIKLNWNLSCAIKIYNIINK